MRTYSYGPIQRFVDTQQGRRAAKTSMCEDLAETPLAQRLQWTFMESCDRVFAQAEARNHDTIRRLAENLGQMEDAESDVARRRAELLEGPTPDLARRGGGEKHLSDEAVQARRQREARAARVPLEVRLQHADDHRSELRRSCREDAAVLFEQFQQVLAIERALRDHAQRRSANYGRAWDRTRDHGNSHVEIPSPWWSEGPCPWIPSNYDDLMSDQVPAPTTKEQR